MLQLCDQVQSAMGENAVLLDDLGIDLSVRPAPRHRDGHLDSETRPFGSGYSLTTVPRAVGVASQAAGHVSDRAGAILT